MKNLLLKNLTLKNTNPFKIRLYSSVYNFPPLPELNELKIKLQADNPYKRSYRDILAKEDVIDFFDKEFCNKIDLKGKTVIELYPGAGILTRSILKQEPKGIIPLDSLKGEFKELLQKLEECTNIPIEHESYDQIPDLSLEKMMQDKLPIESRKLPRNYYPSDTLHPDLVMIATMNDEWKSTQLINYLIESCYNKEGWFKYGRIPVYLLIHQNSIKKIGKGQKVPWALTALFDVYIEGLNGNKFELEPKNFNEDKIQLIPSNSWLLKAGKRRVGVVGLLPLKESKIKAPLHIFTNILFLFGLSKSSKLKSAIKTLDPGSEAVLKLIPQIDPNTKCKDLSMEQLDEISLAYLEWYRLAFGKEPRKPQYIV